MDLDVGGLALVAAHHLVDEDARVGQREALALGAAREQQRAHAHGAAHADGAHVRLDELHRVVDGQPGVHAAARAVDVQADVLVRVVDSEVDQLRHDEVGDLVDHRRAQEDDALVEQPREDVERALAAARLLDHERDKWSHVLTLFVCAASLSCGFPAAKPSSDGVRRSGCLCTRCPSSQRRVSSARPRPAASLGLRSSAPARHASATKSAVLASSISSRSASCLPDFAQIGEELQVVAAEGLGVAA